MPSQLYSFVETPVLTQMDIHSELDEIENTLQHSIHLFETDDEFTKDGMDAVVCKINFNDNTLEYAAANNAFYIMREDEMIEQKAQKMPKEQASLSQTQQQLLLLQQLRMQMLMGMR